MGFRKRYANDNANIASPEETKGFLKLATRATLLLGGLLLYLHREDAKHGTHISDMVERGDLVIKLKIDGEEVSAADLTDAQWAPHRHPARLLEPLRPSHTIEATLVSPEIGEVCHTKLADSVVENARNVRVKKPMVERPPAGLAADIRDACWTVNIGAVESRIQKAKEQRGAAHEARNPLNATRDTSSTERM